MDEKQYMEELKANGVELPELKEKTEEPIQEPTQETPKVEPQEPKKEPTTEPLQEEPEEPRKRSIYDEYKEKKSELKSERELREQAERERDELRTKYEALSSAKTPQEKQEARDDIEAFAQEIDADPQTIKRMHQLFLKDVLKSQGLSEEDRKAIEEIRAFKEQNQKAIEKQRFDEEFKSTIPVIKDFFPKVSADELDTVRAKLDELSHSKGWHNKPLDYIVFKNKDTLSALISPKKRGLEGKSTKDITEESFDFDPNADYSKMTPKQREAWEAEYHKLGKTEGLITDAQGRKLLI